MKVLYPWKMIGRYADDEEIEVGGFDEEDCMTRLISKIEKHGGFSLVFRCFRRGLCGW